MSDRPASRRDIAKARTQAVVLDAARAEFAEHGYHGATIRGIAARAGKSTGAIFNSWPGKADLYREVAGHGEPSDAAWTALHAAVEAFHLSRDRRVDGRARFIAAVETALGRPYVPDAALERARQAEAA